MKRILFIDDEPGQREVWQRFHETMDSTFRGMCEMRVASDLETGLHMLQKDDYDAVIMDYHLPSNGKLTVQEFLARYSRELPPIIVLTGDEDIYVRRECLRFGASGFFTKSDAMRFPNLFFKCVYNEYMKWAYATQRETPTV